MDSPRTILVVDDEPPVRRLLRRCFESESYAVREAANGTEALDALDVGDVDLMTLDLNLGGENGLDVARRVRAAGIDVAIIMVSGKGELIDKVVGLELGADDYIAKPFELREVLARVRSVLRRTGSTASVASETEGQAADDDRSGDGSGPAVAADRPADTDAATEATTEPDGVFGFAHCTLDVPAREFRGADGEPQALTTAEFELLHLFVRSGRRALSRDHIMDALRGVDWHPNDRTIDNHVARLRRKLDAAGATRAIGTVRGVGYQFVATIARGGGRPAR